MARTADTVMYEAMTLHPEKSGRIVYESWVASLEKKSNA